MLGRCSFAAIGSRRCLLSSIFSKFLTFAIPLDSKVGCLTGACLIATHPRRTSTRPPTNYLNLLNATLINLSKPSSKYKPRLATWFVSGIKDLDYVPIFFFNVGAGAESRACTHPLPNLGPRGQL